MQSIDRRRFLAASATLPFAGALIARGEQGVQPGKFAPAMSGREIMRSHYFPNVSLVTHEGKRVRFYDDLLKDKIVVFNLMYADCSGVCPTITSHLITAQKILRDRFGRERFGRDIFFYSLTVKPEEDTPRKLKEYAKMHGVVGPGWLFLTGKPDDVDLLRGKLGYADIDPKVDKDKASHSGMVRYGNEPLAQWGACQGSAKPEWIAEEISFVIPRDSKGKKEMHG
jgi:protein SCO1/2